MAVRPLVTTGAALLSAGALVAATPALFVPNDEVKVAVTAPAPATKSMTVEQLKLLASLQQISDAFFSGYGGIVTGDPQNPGDCDAEGAVCPGGFVGVPYLLIDEALPNTLIDNYFFETGFVGTAEYILTQAGVDPVVRGLIFDPVGTISDLIVEGVDAAFPNTFIAGITNAFLGDYKGNTGFVGAIQYVVDTIIGAVEPPDATPAARQQLTTTVTEEGDEGTDETEGDITDGDVSVLASTNTEQGNTLTRLARAFGVGPASTEIGTGTLVDVNAGTEEEAENSEDLGAGEVGTGAEEGNENSGTEVTTPVANTGGTTTVDPEASEGETGTTTPTGAEGTEEVKPVKEVKETETEDTKTVDTKGGNKVTPGVIFETGHKGGGGSGGWINDTINTLKKAFNGGGKTTQKPADTNDGGADNGGSEGGGDE